jgi:hypothetical protein
MMMRSHKRKTFVRSLLTALVLLGCLAGVARAEPPPGKSDDQGWEKVDGSMLQQGETIPARSLVAGAYGFIFFAVLVFVVSVTARSRRVEEEMEALKRKLEGGPAKGGAAGGRP